MNAGFTVAWIAFVAVVLLATGWQPLLCPESRNRPVVGGLLALLLLLPLPLLISFTSVSVSLSILLLLLLSAIAWLKLEGWGDKGYVLLCSLFLAFASLSLRRLYAAGPSFHLLDPAWDVALLTAVMTALFTTSERRQFIMLAWGAVTGEWLTLEFLIKPADPIIGTLAWWDSFAIALAGSRLISMLWRGVRSTGEAGR